MIHVVRKVLAFSLNQENKGKEKEKRKEKFKKKKMKEKEKGKNIIRQERPKENTHSLGFTWKQTSDVCWLSLVTVLAACLGTSNKSFFSPNKKTVS